MKSKLPSIFKGIPGRNLHAGSLDEIKNISLLDEGFELPICILKEQSLTRNRRRMKRILDHYQAFFAPHGKTTMSPELFNLQLEDGAWAITLSTTYQARVARAAGIKRIFYANELVGKSSIAYILDELERDKEFDFYCLVDDKSNVEELASAVRRRHTGIRLNVLIEMGFDGGRAGCRTVSYAKELAKMINTFPELRLTGIEGFEGLIHGESPVQQEKEIRSFLGRVLDIFDFCVERNLFPTTGGILSAGGSAFYDMVLGEFSEFVGNVKPILLIRSGCYLTHDSHMYVDFNHRLERRQEGEAIYQEQPSPALEVWGYVISRPEPCKIIVNAGKRDMSYDDLPVPEQLVKFGSESRLTALVPGEYEVLELNDQHCHIRVPSDANVVVGDAIQFGISHPCLTFDKWRLIPVVNDRYEVVDCVTTYF